MTLIHNLPMCTLSPALRHWSQLSSSSLSLSSPASLPLSLRHWLCDHFAYLSARVSGPGSYKDSGLGNGRVVQCSSDSSSFGAGFFVGELVNSWEWPVAQAAWHIYSKELSAALSAIDCALTDYPAHDINLELDNTASLHTLTHWYSKCDYWNGPLWNMWSRVQKAGVKLSCEYRHTSVTQE